VSQKYPLFAERAEQLQQRGMPRKGALLLMASQAAVPIAGEWLEAFWCDSCQTTRWYHVCRQGDRSYTLSIAPVELWQQAAGVVDPKGNPSVGAFTLRQSRALGFRGVKDFNFIR